MFIYQGGAAFHVPNPAQLMKFGGWSAVRVVHDMTLGQFTGSPRDGTLLREFSDNHVFVWTAGAFIPSQVAPHNDDVRLVPDGAIQSRLLDKLSLDYSAIASGGSCPGTVSLKTAFPGADISVALASNEPAVATTSTLLAAIVLVAGGAYQFTPLKQTCLRSCRSPLEVIMQYWNRGPFGIGLRHGLFCLGCCWVLMLLLFVGGIMNLVWVALIATFVLVEKVVPRGEWLSYGAGAALISWGTWTLYLQIFAS